jgi:hypothetical protein
VKFSSVVSIEIFRVKNANPYFYAKRIENGYFPLPSKFEMMTPNVDVLINAKLNVGNEYGLCRRITCLQMDDVH